MRVGAHSIRHPRLTQLDDDVLQAEIEGSVDAVRRLGGPVAFAYPDGAYEERVVRAAPCARR
jgi:peptidoglycan/xylan/chitin deacetylase (PgdA/CDA1 family)